MSERLSTFTIFNRPLDAPESFVVRRFEIFPNHVVPREAFLFSTLEGARASLPAGLVCFARRDDDEPQIVETWL
jgi:hypothetical protein